MNNAPTDNQVPIIEGEFVKTDSKNRHLQLDDKLYGTLNRAYNLYKNQQAEEKEIKKRRKHKKLLKRQKKHHK